jgi:hypothetical protein
VALSAGESRSFADDVSLPEGDTSDVIVIRMDGLRQPVDYLLTLSCSGQGTEFIVWSARRISPQTGCGRGVQVTFSPDNSQIIVDIGFAANARPSYVRYNLDIAPVRR